MIGRAASKEAYDLFHQGQIALAQVESNGFKINTDYIDKRINELRKQVGKMEDRLQHTEVFRLMEERYGQAVNLDSREQLATVIFKDMGYKCKEWTEGKVDKETGKVDKRPKADETALRDTGLPFVEKYLNLSRKKSTINFLSRIAKETCNDRVHCFFNLGGGTADDRKGDPRTYRSSSDSPNLHNMPIRNEEMGEEIRTAFKPTDKDYLLIEADFKGIEVSIAYCYHKDPVMKKYLMDKTSDMHKDMAVQCYMLEKYKAPEGWWKKKGSKGGSDFRYCAKNKFVFPEFYGDWWMSCAKHLWEDIDRMNLHLHDGMNARDWLRSRGIKSLGKQDPEGNPVKGTFEHHLKEVENDFWNNRFKVYGKWKRDWYSKYLERGWFPMNTGFICSGNYNRKQVCNYSIQGSAFHCLLWCLIRLQKWLNKHSMKTKIVSQVHDSMILDSPRKEYKKVIHKIQHIMREELLNEWKWIIIPLDVEIEIAEESWFKKVPYKED